MPTISHFFGIFIRMYFNDHPPPHFHAIYNDFQAVINIEKIEVIEGFLPQRALNLVFEWTQIHQTELLADWELCNSKQQPFKIAPLE